MRGILFLLLFAPFVAKAELRLDSPERLLEKAATSRTACREVILDLRQNVQEMREPAVFDRYFGILDELAGIAARHRMDEIFPDAVKRLGQEMTANGVRWLSLGRDPAEKVLAYHRWMNEIVAFTFLANVEVEAKILPESSVRQFALNMERLIPFIDEAFPEVTGLRVGYRNLLSEVAAKRLAREDLPEEERLFWLGKVRTAQGFGTALSQIQNGLALVPREEKARLRSYLGRLLVLGDRILGDAGFQEAWLLGQLGDLAVQLVVRMAEYEELFLTGEFPKLLTVMQPRHLQSLAQVWVSVERTPEGAYAEHYLFLTGQFLSYLEQKGLRQEAENVRRYQSRLAAPVVAKSKKLEGSYALKSSTGKRWVFTVALARESTLYLALQDDLGFVGKGFFNVVYSSENDTFVASEREVDTDPERNLTVKFRLLGNGKIEVRDVMAVPEEQLLLGEKFENYPDYFQEKSAVRENDPSGTYEGIVPIGKKDRPRKMTLVVTAFGGYTLGRLADEKRTLHVDFNIGSRATDSVLYLTTGRIRMGWLQMRGVVKNGEYRGYVVGGGRGIADREFVLKKISD